MMALEGATNTSTPTAFQFVDLPRLYIHTLPTPYGTLRDHQFATRGGTARHLLLSISTASMHE